MVTHMRWGLLIFLIQLVLFSSCSTRFTTTRPKPSSKAKESKLYLAAQEWLGTPYRYGGNDRNGIDCSGLACQLYQQVYHFTLPRQANAQRRLGYSVFYPYLKAGDLIFFRFAGEEHIEHVGIYLGNDVFIHASSRRGVVLDRLSNPYFKQHIVVIKRILH